MSLFIISCEIDTPHEFEENDNNETGEINDTNDDDKISREVFTIGSYHITDFTNTRAERMRNTIDDIITEFDVLYVDGIGSDVINSFNSILEDLNMNYITMVDDDIRRLIVFNERVVELESFDVIESGLHNDFFEAVFIMSDEEIVVSGLRMDRYNAMSEIRRMDEVIAEYDDNVLFMGTMYSDCLYYNTRWSRDFEWLIPHNIDTTSEGRGCSFDKIISQEEHRFHIEDYGVIEKRDLDRLSEHLPVFVRIMVN